MSLCEPLLQKDQLIRQYDVSKPPAFVPTSRRDSAGAEHAPVGAENSDTRSERYVATCEQELNMFYRGLNVFKAEAMLGEHV
jgi:hypothetical protein